MLIYDQGNNYRGAGALVSNNVVVTVAHKVQNYVDRANSLKVRLGDWNPNKKDDKEDYDFVEREVDCVILHPDQDLTDTLANNVAVLKLKPRDRDRNEELKMKNTVSSAITLFTGEEEEERTMIAAEDLERPGNRVEGVEGSRIIQNVSPIDLRLGLVATERDLNGLGGSLTSSSSSGKSSPLTIVEMSYYNTVCLPSSSQFRNYKDRCWVASWGNRQERQREISLPLLSR